MRGGNQRDFLVLGRGYDQRFEGEVPEETVGHDDDLVELLPKAMLRSVDEQIDQRFGRSFPFGIFKLCQIQRAGITRHANLAEVGGHALFDFRDRGQLPDGMIRGGNHHPVRGALGREVGQHELFLAQSRLDLLQRQQGRERVGALLTPQRDFTQQALVCSRGGVQLFGDLELTFEIVGISGASSAARNWSRSLATVCEKSFSCGYRLRRSRRRSRTSCESSSGAPRASSAARAFVRRAVIRKRTGADESARRSQSLDRPHRAAS